MYTILLSIIATVLIFIAIYVSIEKNSYQENLMVDVSKSDNSYGQYFNPYFVRPTTCMETLFGTVECYNLPTNIWTNDWWFNR